MKHLSTPAFAALLVGLGAVSATPAQALDFNWGTDLVQPRTNAVSGGFTIEDIEAFRNTFSGLQPGTPSPRFPIANPTLIVDGMDTGAAVQDPDPPFIELLQDQPGPAGPIWDVWSIHFHNSWDWTWITFGAFASTEEAIDAILTPGNLAEGTAMLMPTDGSPTRNFAVGVQTAPEPLTILGSLTALGFGALFKRELSKRKDSEQDC